jgi:hypothetical protein
MSGSPSFWLPVLISAATILAAARLVLWRRLAPASAAGPPWRLPALIGLNVAAALLLYLTLDPPDVGLRRGQLVLLTGGAQESARREAGDLVAALPEAPGEASERVPDLATALRRHPEVRGIQVLGAGLTARDRPAVDRSLVFDPPAAPSGFVRLSLPQPVPAGAPFSVSGVIGTLATGAVELADPSGAVVNRAAVSAGASFVLNGAAKAAGLTLFELRLKDDQGRLVERIDVPLEAREAPPPRVIVMAGAPGPEPRFLRRWAEEAGIDLTVRLALGAGVDLVARPTPLTAQTLSETDLLVIDERRWESLGGEERAAIRAATAGGMGLLLRPTGPLPDTTRREWAALGAALTGGDSLRPLSLEGAPSAPALEAAREPATNETPELTRRDFTQGGAEAAVLIRDADGAALATWRPYGAGRVGVWVVADSYALVLTGQVDRYGTLWSRMFSALARPEGEPPPRLDGMARAGWRVALCGVRDGDVLTNPDGGQVRLIVDPRAGPRGCAAVWPRKAGWHAVMQGESERGAFYVHAADAAPSLAKTELSTATLDLARSGPAETRLSRGRATDGSAWPWFLALVMVVTVLWWLERRRPARRSTNGDPRLS